MAGKFVLTAQLQIQAPTNLTQVRRQIQQQIGNVTITPVINTQSLANANKQLQNTAANAAKASANLKTAGRSAQSLGAALGSAARRFAAITLATGFFLGLARGITEAFSRAVDFEKELLKISQVTGKSMNALKGLTSEVTRLSTSLGVSSSELLNASRTLAQAGFSAQKTKQALEILARTDLAATFDNLADTTEGAIAILRQFRGEARAAGGDIKFLAQAMDAINSVSKSFAVESADLIAAVRRTGGVFEAAGGKLNELIALFTSVRATTRETAETIATGFRTIFTRIQRSETIEQLRELGIELRTVKGEFVGPLEAIKRLQIGLAGLSATDYRFQEIIEQLGGFRQVGKVIPLLKQYDTTVQALAIANMSAGSTARDAETAQQGLGNAFAKLKEKFDATVRSIADGETFQSLARGAIQLADSILKVVKALEPLLPMLSSIAAMQLGKLVVPAFGRFAGIGKNQGGRIYGFNKGGFVPGTGNRDTVPAMLTPGEFVIKKSSVESIGAQRLAAMNGYTNGGKQSKVAGFNTGKLGALAGMSPTGTLGFRAMPNTVAAVSMNPIGYDGQYNPTKPYGIERADKLRGVVLPAKERKLIADKYFGGDEKQARAHMYNFSVLPPSKPYKVSSPQLGMLKSSEFGTIMDQVSRSAISDGVQSAIAKISGQLDLPPALNVDENNLEKAKATSAADDTAARTFQGFLYEGVIGALTGAMTTGGTASFDLGRTAMAGNRKRLKKMFDSQISMAQVAEVKRSKDQAASQDGIPKKLYNYIARSGRSALRHGMIQLAQYNKGGSVDSVPAMLTPGEYVINKSSAQAIGYSNLNSMNKTGVAHFNKGGPVGMNQGGRLQAVGNAAMMTAFMAPMVIEFTNLADETKQLVQQFVMLGGIMAMIGAQTGSALGGFFASIVTNTVATNANTTSKSVNTAMEKAAAAAPAALGILGGAIGLIVGGIMAHNAQLEQERKKMAKSFSEFIMRIKEGGANALGDMQAQQQNLLGAFNLSDQQLRDRTRDEANRIQVASARSGSPISAAQAQAGLMNQIRAENEDLINTVNALGQATIAAAKTIGEFNRETRILAEKGLEGDALIKEQTRIAEQFISNANSAKDARAEYDRLAEAHAAGLMSSDQYREAVQQLNDVTAEQGKVAFQVADTIRNNMQSMVQTAIDQNKGFADIEKEYERQLQLLQSTLYRGFLAEALASGMEREDAEKAARKATRETVEARRNADKEMLHAAQERAESARKLAILEVQLAQAERARAQALQEVNVQFIEFGHATDAAKAALGQITGAIQNVKVTSGDLIATLKDGFNVEGAAALTSMGFGATAGRLRENEAMRTNFEGIIGDPTELMKLEPMERMKEVLNKLGVDAEGVSAEAKEALKKLFEDGFQASDISELMDILGHNVDEVIDAAGKLAKAQQMQVDAIAMFGDAIRKQAQTIRQANMDMVDVIKRGNARLRDAMDIDLSVRDARAEQGMAIGAMLGGRVPMAGANDAQAFNFGLGNALQAADIGAAIQKLEEQLLMAQINEKLTNDPAAQQEAINKQKLLNQEIANAEEALKLLANQADLAAAVMTEIDKEKSKREAMQKSIENYTFATNDGRRQIDQSFMALQRVLMAGNIEAIPDQMRGAVANLLDQFKDVELIPGMTGEMIKKQLQVRQLEMNFRRMTGGRQGAPPELIKAIFKRTDKEDQLINELRAISQREQDAQNLIREREIAKQEEIRQEAKKTNQNLADMVNELGDAVTALENMQPAKANARGGLIQAFANGGSVFKPRGTDTVPAMLTPGEFVIRKSAVDKIGTSTLSAINNGNTSVVYRQNGSTGPERPRTGTGDPLANRLAAGARKGLDYRQSINDPDWMAEQFYRNLDYAMNNAPHKGIEDLGAWLDSLVEQNVPMIPGVKHLSPRRKGDLSWAAALGKKRTAETLMGTGMYHTLPADILGMLALLGVGRTKDALDPQGGGSILSTLKRLDHGLISKVMKNDLVYGSTFLGEPLAVDRGGAGLGRRIFEAAFGAGALDKFYPTFRNMYVNEKMDTLLDKTLDYREARLDVGRPSMVAAGRRVDLQVMKRRFGMRATRPGKDFLMKQQALFGITSRIPTVPREYAVKRMREGKILIDEATNTIMDTNGNRLPVGISGKRKFGSFFADGSRNLLPAHLHGLVEKPFELLKDMNAEVMIAAQFLPEKFQKMLLQSQHQAVANSHRQGYFRMNQFFGGQAIAGFARGGSVDSVPAMLTPGEFVMSASAVKKHGTGFMNSVNKGKIPGFARGGSVGGVQYRQNGGAIGGMGQNMMDAIAKSLSIFDNLAGMLNDIAVMFSNLQISHTIQVDGTLNIPGFSQQAINNIVNTIGEQVVLQTENKINVALDEFNRKLDQRAD